MELPSFLRLPERGGKPRSDGITHVLDKGRTLESMRSILSEHAAHIDIWKFGWGTSYLDTRLIEKLALLGAAGIRGCLGGTLLEIAWMQGRDRECLDWARRAGFGCVEVSRGVAPMSVTDKHELLRAAAERFVVLSEVGCKDPDRPLAPAEWTDEIAGDLAAGARWVIAEGRESGTVGIYRGDGTLREDIVAAAVRGADTARLLFETPRKDQQAWLIRRFGPRVNLANVPCDEALAVETLRLGLRADTCDPARPRQPV